jgi:hypothetical protein
LLEATSRHVRQGLQKGRVARRLLPPLFHAATSRAALGIHPVQDELYVCCSVQVLYSSSLGLKLPQRSFAKQTPLIVPV